MGNACSQPESLASPATPYDALSPDEQADYNNSIENFMKDVFKNSRSYNAFGTFVFHGYINEDYKTTIAFSSGDKRIVASQHISKFIERLQIYAKRPFTISITPIGTTIFNRTHHKITLTSVFETPNQSQSLSK